MNTTEPQEETIFTEELHQMSSYEEATKGQRFVNYLIDNILMGYGLSYLTGTIVGYILGMIAPEWVLSLEEESVELIFIGYLIAIFNYLIYYTICEKAFRGYTLGKLITGTRAIRDDGEELTTRDAFLRSASRLVPFEPFSAFGDRVWHDSWTKTTVIKAR
jgi:uncharacterized RDD family membrane protein YckC